MKKVLITKMYKEKRNNGFTRLNFVIKTENKEDILWYEVEDKYSQYICDDRCDCAIVSIFTTAICAGYDTIETNLPISEKLFYNLKYHIIPQFTVMDRGKYPNLNIIAPTTNETFKGKAVGAEMSEDVDSFATMYEYTKEIEFDAYKITHFTYNNITPNYGSDIRLGSMKELYKEQLNKIKDFCKKYKYELIITDTNITELLGNAFDYFSFSRFHTFRNAGTALLLQKLYGKYYYSSTGNLDNFKSSFSTPSAAYEKWLFPYLSCGSTEFYNSNKAWGRLEKIKIISNLKESYDYLTVCSNSVENCGECDKCKETLMTLDVLGVLDKYKNSFDVNKYKENFREQWFNDIYNYGVKNDFPYIKEPILEKYEKDTIGRIKFKKYNIRKMPSKESELVLSARKNQPYICIGKFDKWIKIRNDKIEGYIYEKGIDIIPTVNYKNNKTATIITSEYNVRIMPAKRANYVVKLKKNDKVFLIKKISNWYLVRTKDGKEGYIYKNGLKVNITLRNRLGNIKRKIFK